MRFLALLLLASTTTWAADFVPVKVDPAHRPIRAIVADGEQLIAAGGGANAELFRSADGERWKRVEIARASGPLRALVGDGHGDLVAVGGARFASAVASADGAVTALPVALAKSATLEALARHGDLTIAAGAEIFTSRDSGDRWSHAPPFAKSRVKLHGLIADENWIAVGEEPSTRGVQGVVLRSNDGARWTRQILSRSPALLAVARAGEKLIAVGRRGTAWMSDDRGASWQPLSLPTHADLRAVASGGSGTWIAGDDGLVLHSDDGAHWTQVDVPTRRALVSILLRGSEVFIGTDDGYLLEAK